MSVYSLRLRAPGLGHKRSAQAKFLEDWTDNKVKPKKGATHVPVPMHQQEEVKLPTVNKLPTEPGHTSDSSDDPSDAGRQEPTTPATAIIDSCHEGAAVVGEDPHDEGGWQLPKAAVRRRKMQHEPPACRPPSPEPRRAAPRFPRLHACAKVVQTVKEAATGATPPRKTPSPVDREAEPSPTMTALKVCLPPVSDAETGAGSPQSPQCQEQGASVVTTPTIKVLHRRREEPPEVFVDGDASVAQKASDEPAGGQPAEDTSSEAGPSSTGFVAAAAPEATVVDSERKLLEQLSIDTVPSRRSTQGERFEADAQDDIIISLDELKVSSFSFAPIQRGDCRPAEAHEGSAVLLDELKVSSFSFAPMQRGDFVPTDAIAQDGSEVLLDELKGSSFSFAAMQRGDFVPADAQDGSTVRLDELKMSSFSFAPMQHDRLSESVDFVSPIQHEPLFVADVVGKRTISEDHLWIKTYMGYGLTMFTPITELAATFRVPASEPDSPPESPSAGPPELRIHKRIWASDADQQRLAAACLRSWEGYATPARVSRFMDHKLELWDLYFGVARGRSHGPSSGPPPPAVAPSPPPPPPPRPPPPPYPPAAAAPPSALPGQGAAAQFFGRQRYQGWRREQHRWVAVPQQAYFPPQPQPQLAISYAYGVPFVVGVPFPFVPQPFGGFVPPQPAFAPGLHHQFAYYPQQ